ncbi:MAG: alpha/beta hydrolase fold domain-containing protein [Phycisphaerales bacterium JB063]
MKRTFFAALLALACTLPTVAQVRQQQRRQTDRHIVYATLEDGTEMKLDLYRPIASDDEATDATPPKLVVWVHGGAWMMGNRWPCPMTFLTDHGYAVASVSYRFSNVAQFPAQLDDCKAAVRFLRANAEHYGYDADHIGVIGASAGGHLAALLGTTGNDPDTEGELGEHLDVSSEVQAVYDLFGPTDLEALSAEIPEESGLAAHSPIALLLGGDPRLHPDLAQAADPVTYLDADDPPVMIAHGTRDPLVPLAQSEYFANALEDAGIEHELIVVQGGGHGGAHFQTPEMIAQLIAFFDEHLVDADVDADTKNND